MIRKGYCKIVIILMIEIKVSEMLEQVTEKLRNKGCHYLTSLEYSENSEWISGILLLDFFMFLSNSFLF